MRMQTTEAESNKRRAAKECTEAVDSLGQESQSHTQTCQPYDVTTQRPLLAFFFSRFSVFCFLFDASY